MADKYPSRGVANWSAVEWDDTDEGHADEGPPGTGESWEFTGNSGTITADVTPAADLGDFTFGGGTLDLNDEDLSIDGHIVSSAAGVSNSGVVTQKGTHNLSWSQWADALLDYVADGDITLTGTVYAKKITVVGSLDVVQQCYIYAPSAPWWGAGGGGVTGNNKLIVLGSNTSPGNDITVGCYFSFEAGSSDKSITMDANLTCTRRVWVRCDAAGIRMTISMDGNNLDAQQLRLGGTAGTGAATFNSGSGTMAIGSGGILMGAAANDENQLNWQEDCTFTCSGDVLLEGIVATAATCSTFACSGHFNIGANGGKFTLVDDLSMTVANTKVWELDGGTIDTSTHMLTVDGDVLYTSGTVTALNLTMAGTSAIAWAVSDKGISRLVIDGTITLSAAVYVAKFKSAAGSSLSGANNLCPYAPPADGWCEEQDGDIDINVLSITNSVKSPGGNLVTLAGSNTNHIYVAVGAGETKAMTWDSSVDIKGALWLKPGDRAIQTFTVDGAPLASLGQFKLGDHAVGTVTANMGGVCHTFGSIAATGGTITLNLQGCSVNIGTTFDGTGIGTITAAGAAMHGGTIQDVATLSGPLWCHGVAEGAGNTSVGITHVPSCLLAGPALMGCGGMAA